MRLCFIELNKIIRTKISLSKYKLNLYCSQLYASREFLSLAENRDKTANEELNIRWDLKLPQPRSVECVLDARISRK